VHVSLQEESSQLLQDLVALLIQHLEGQLDQIFLLFLELAILALLVGIRVGKIVVLELVLRVQLGNAEVLHDEGELIEDDLVVDFLLGQHLHEAGDLHFTHVVEPNILDALQEATGSH
jgi:hypothetical protein